ncbi:MAG: glycosylhydrolase-like jelly roll fold domain-containing protein, partial [Verrucomicrobiota bacterium]
LETMKSLLKLEKEGVTVLYIDGMPQTVPGFHRWEEREAELQSFIAQSKKRIAPWGDINRGISDTPAKRERMKRHGLDFIRRTHDEGYHYFIANLGSQVVDRWTRLGTSFKSVVIMDPQTGASGVASDIRKGNEVYLQLQPGESRILRTFTSKKIKGDLWPLFRPTSLPHQVKGEWKVDFIEGEPTLPGSFTTPILGSWTGAADPDAERFSGTARYSIEFDLPAKEADEWVLELGDVRESARVRINGEEAGILYSAPFRVEIGPFLQAGRNVLEVEVTNLSFNRIRDLDARGVEWKIFYDINFVDHLYEDYDATKWGPVASGLLGPVTLTPMKKFQPED